MVFYGRNKGTIYKILLFRRTSAVNKGSESWVEPGNAQNPRRKGFNIAQLCQTLRIYKYLGICSK
jgi:hypothetical protein